MRYGRTTVADLRADPAPQHTIPIEPEEFGAFLAAIGVD